MRKPGANASRLFSWAELPGDYVRYFGQMAVYPAVFDKETIMLYWAAVFFVIALVAGVLGFGGVAGATAGIAQILFFLFLVFLVLSLIAGLVRRV